MIQPITQKIIKQLQKSDLSSEDRVALTTALLNKLSALPLSNSIIVTQDGISINGKPLDREQTINFKESCVVLKDNFARKVLIEQVRFLAVNLGINVALSVDTIMFAKAALWVLQQEDELLDKIYAS